MPITPSYSWSETEKYLRIEATLTSAVDLSSAEFTCTDAFLKINSSPYLLLIDFKHPVNAAKATTTLQKPLVKFKIPKVERCMWGELEWEGTKTEKAARREKALESHMARLAEERSSAKETKKQDDDFVFHKQWDLEKDQKKVIEKSKADEKRIAEEDLYEWVDVKEDEAPPEEAEGAQEPEALPKQEETTAAPNEPRDDGAEKAAAVDPPAEPVAAEPRTRGAAAANKPARSAIWDDAEQAKVTAGIAAARAKPAAAVVPPPRQSVKVDIKFTPKPNNMPARESLEDDAEEDPTKDYVPDVASVNDTVWLKERGVYFFKLEDYIAASNAYTAAIEFHKKDPVLYINRSACNLQLHNFTLVIEDTSTAVSLIDKAAGGKIMSSDQARHMGIALARRGMSYWRLGLLNEGLGDITRSSKLLPEDIALRVEAEELVRLSEQADFYKLKAEADELFKKGEVERSVEVYTKALENDPGCFMIWSNRAAALLTLKRYQESMDDCSQALMILDPRNDGGETRLALRPLVRRANASVWLGEFEAARHDLKRALKLDPHNEKLKHDLALIDSDKAHPMQQAVVDGIHAQIAASSS